MKMDLYKCRYPSGVIRNYPNLYRLVAENSNGTCLVGILG